jgi:hypothetical protein
MELKSHSFTSKEPHVAREPQVADPWARGLRNAFARSNTGIVGSNPTQSMDVCLRLFCVCRGLATGLIPRPRRPTGCIKLRN